MFVSELIEVLQRIKDQEGDLQIRTQGSTSAVMEPDCIFVRNGSIAILSFYGLYGQSADMVYRPTEPEPRQII